MRAAQGLGAVLALALGSVASAETLEEAWRFAEAHDFSLAASRSEAEAAQFAVTAARGQRLPAVAVGGSFTQLNDAPAFDFSASGLPVQLPEIFRNDNFVMGGFKVSLPLYTSGRITSQLNAAAAEQQARAANVDRTRSDVRLAVAESYVAVLRAERLLAVAESNVASLSDYARDVTAMFNRETVPRNDMLSAQVALANAEQLRLQARNGVDLARAAYNRHVGQPLDRSVTLEVIPANVVPDAGAGGLAALATRALAKRQELVGLEAQGTALGFAARAERARLGPQVALTGGYQYLENQMLDRDHFAMAGVELQWALFDGGQTRNRAASLARTQRAAEQRLAEYRSLIELEVRQAWLSLQEAQARIPVTRAAVEQAEENLRISTQQYAAGLVNSTRVLEAEALRTGSRANSENAALDAELMRIRLARAVGEL